MIKYLGRLILAGAVLLLGSSGEIKAETGSMGYIGPTSTPSSQNTDSSKSTASESSNSTVNPASSSNTSNNSSTTKSTSSSSTKTTTAKAAAVANASTINGGNNTASLDNAGVSSNVQAASVQVAPYSGSAGLSIPITVPAGRAGIQPNLSLTYSSNNKQVGNAGVGWILDLGSIQISSKKGVPKYDGTDIFTMEQAGATQDLVADPNTAGLYHMEVEGSFAQIQYFTTYWLITDKKGIKYYYGNYGSASGCIQNDPANPTHIFRWALSRVEDLNGNYMTISYLQDNGQIYPQTISYTGNDQSSLILSPYAQVSISYVAATQPSTSYISQFLVETAQRIDHITVSVGPNVQSTYTFTYVQSQDTGRDLLQSVTQTGSDGSSTLPPITFTYSSVATNGNVTFNQATGWNIPAGLQFSSQGPNQYGSISYTTNGVQAVDINGDGYADLVKFNASDCGGGSDPTNGVYINNHQNGWVLNPSYPWPAGVFLADQCSYAFNMFSSNGEVSSHNVINKSEDLGVKLIDIDGDGKIDIVQAATQGQSTTTFNGSLSTNFSFYLSQSNQLQNQTLNIPGFTSDYPYQFPQAATNGGPVINVNSFYSVPENITFADVNGDGLPDIVSTVVPDSIYINQKNQTTSQINWQMTTPSYSHLGNVTQSELFADLNGDGLSDIISISAVYGNFVYMNTGNGWVQDTNSPWLQGIDSTNCDFSTGSGVLVDLNGDGLPDLICNGTSQKVYLNTGHGWAATDTWSLPGLNFTNLSTQFLDANADGLMDYLVYSPSIMVPNPMGSGTYTYDNSSTPQLYLNPASVPSDLLVGVNNGIGASTSIQYDSDFHYQNTFMPYFLPVVKSTSTTIGSQSYTTTYNYAGGLWDGSYREFDGFQTVKVIDANGNYVTTTYLQDHWLKGHPSEQDTYDSNGNLYSKSVDTWATQTIATNTTSNQISKFPYIARTDNYLYDGNSAATPKRTAQEYTYGENPQYGDPTQVINDGQVDPTAGTSIDPNKTVSQMTYVNNTSNWLIGLPSQTITQNVNGNTISKTSFYYDGDTTGTATPVLGRLTSKINWLGSNTQADPKTTYSYDAYGNLQSTTDPNGNTTTITYDNTVHMFPEQTSNALKQTIAMTYYGIDAAPLNNGQGLQGLWGQDRSKTDANNQTAYTTYDVFGRPSTSISPLDSAALPTEQKSYNIQSTYIAITDTARVINGSSATISTVSYYDGLGRLIETKSLGPTAGQYIASGQTVYDNRGLPITKYVPHFTSNNLNTMDTIDSTVPSSQAVYDPMGRMVTKTNPDGSYSSVTYNQWTTTTTDENGHMQQSVVDAFGHLVQKQEYMGADGRSPNYPSASFTLYATTTYNYDPKGNLISVVDAHNNTTSITYDNLGRKISMNDPDMGKWQYVYDGNSNLIAQQDAKGQVISFKYDALNRLMNKTDAINGPIVNLPNITPQAATFNVNYNFDSTAQSFGIGRLSSVGYDTGTAGFIYDQLGRESSSNKNLANGNYNVTRQYDALNRLQQMQYPDGSQVAYVYNQAGQIAGVADAAAVTNGTISGLALNNEISNDHLAWFDKALGVNNAYAASAGNSSFPTTGVLDTFNRSNSGNLGSNWTSSFNGDAGQFTIASDAATNTQAEKIGDYWNVATYGPNEEAHVTWSKIGTSDVLRLSLRVTAGGGGILNSYDGYRLDISGSSWLLQVENNSNATTITNGSYTQIVNPGDSVGIQAIGNTISAWYCPNGSNCALSSNWKLVGSGTDSTYASAGYIALEDSNTGGTSSFTNFGGGTEGSILAPSITTQPVNATVTAPATATFSVVATGTPTPTYQWQQEAPGASTYTAISGATSASYTTPATTTANSGAKYECVVTNTAGSVTSNAATLTVNALTVAPSITTQPVNATVTAPATANFTVGASGSPAPTYQWMQEAVGANTFTAISGATNSSYITPATTTANNGTKYECVITNSAGSVTSNAVTLTVNSGSTAPVVNITSPVNNSTVAAGSNATITASASETSGTIKTVSFYYNGAYLLGTSTASPYSYTVTDIPAGTYILTAVATDVNGVATTSSPITVTVSALVAPSITSQPANATVTAPATANFTVAATGTPTPTYQWMQKASGASSYTAISGATSTSYTSAATTATNSGTQYECVVTNSAGSMVSNTAMLTVNEPMPTVSLSANSSTYAAPASVILTATAAQQYGTISRVDFYNGSTLLGSSSSTPFTYTWSNVAAGNYSLTAEAYNNNGVETTSSPINVSVVAPNVYIKAINYNANGQITQIQYGNGAVTAYTYDPLSSRLMRIYTSNAQAVIIQDLNYTYDSIGQVLSIKDNVNTASQTFTYDALNRLASATGSYGTKTYTYDSIGNITQKDGLSYTYSGAGPHAVTSLSDGTVFNYDPNGNMISLQKGSNLTQYAYDSQNRLQTVTVGGLKAATYVYDGDGGRTQKTVYRRDLALYNDNVNALLFGSATNPLPATAQNPTVDTTLYVGNVYESESATDGSSRQTKFIYLGSTRVAAVGADGSVFYYHTDHLGGTNVLTDNTGVVREETEYDPFGQVIKHDKYGNNFETAWFYFTGKHLDDETGLIFLGARYYNPLLGRFITPDTVVQAPSNPQTLNRYTYCNNNPVNLVDPTGHSWFSKLFKAIGQFFTNLVKNPVATILDAIAILVAIVIPTPASPFIIASAALNYVNIGTSSWQGGGWNTFHQVLGYASMALAAVGAIQDIASAFSQTTGATESAASATQAASATSLPGDSAPDFSKLTLDQTLVHFNSDGASIIEKVTAATVVANTAGQTGAALQTFTMSTGFKIAESIGNGVLKVGLGTMAVGAAVVMLPAEGGAFLAGTTIYAGGYLAANLGAGLSFVGKMGEYLANGNFIGGAVTGAISTVSDGIGQVASDIYGVWSKIPVSTVVDNVLHSGAQWVGKADNIAQLAN